MADPPHATALPVPELAVLELPPEQRDDASVRAVAAALGENSVIELPFLRSLDAQELLEACRKEIRIDRIKPGEAICLQGEEADSAYVVLSGTVSCHIRKDLQQKDAALAFSELLGEIEELEAAKVAAEERAAEKRAARHSVLGAKDHHGGVDDSDGGTSTGDSFQRRPAVAPPPVAAAAPLSRAARSHTAAAAARRRCCSGPCSRHKVAAVVAAAAARPCGR